jgi:hypothetical protein
MGSQPPFAPDDLEPFVAAPRIAVLSYVKRDGTPAQAPIWYRYRDGRFEMLTSRTAPKAKALARTRRACLTVQDEMPPYRAVIVDGEVTVTDVSPDVELNGWLALLTLDPVRVRGFDNHRLIGRGLRLYMRVREALPVPRAWL